MFGEAISLLSIWTSMSSWLTPTFLFLFLNLMIGTIFITSSFASSSKPHPHNHQEIVVNHFHNHHQQQPSQITRAPSVLQRLKSINFYSYYSQNPSQENLSSPGPMPELGPRKVPAQAQAQAQTRSTTQLESGQFPAWVAPTYKNRTQNQIQTHSALELEPTIQTQTRTHPAWAPPIEEDITDDEGPTLDEIYNRIKGITSAHHNRQNSDTAPMGGEIPVRLPARMKKSASDESAFNHFQAENEAAEADEREMIAVAGHGGGDEVDSRADDFINNFNKQLQIQRNESILRYKNMITNNGSGK